MPKFKKITFDPVAHLKTLPSEFWLKVPTYKDIFREPMLMTWCYDHNGRRCDKRPDACEEFPQYAEFFDKYEAASKLALNTNYEDGKPRRDWVEYTIGDFSFRYQIDCGRPTRYFSHPDLYGWERCDNSYLLAYGPHMDAAAAGYKHTDEGVKLKKAYDRAEKKVASTWNSLRKKARREAGLDLDAKVAKKKAISDRERRQQETRKETSDHIRDLINDLLVYQKRVEAGTFTRAQVRDIFDMTNHLTSLNKKLKDAHGVR